MVDKPNDILTSTKINDLLVEDQDLLEEHMDVIVDDFPCELPLVRSVSHHIDLIVGAIFTNKLLTG